MTQRWTAWILLGSLAMVAPVDAAVDSGQPIRLTGFVEASYPWASNTSGDVIIGQLYQRDQEQFALNAFTLGVDRPLRTDTISAGFTVRAMFGRSATLIHAAGLDLGGEADLTQAFGTFNVPAGRGAVQISAGKMATLMGLEIIESVGNPNVTPGNQFAFAENFTDVGLDVNWVIDPMLSIRGRVINGWDVAKDNNEARSFMGRVGWTPNTELSVALLGFTGPEQAGNVSDLRSGAEALITWKRGGHAFSLQSDVGHEQGIDARWWGAGAWVVLGLRPNLDLALRGDILDDEDGARTSGILGYPVHDGQRLTTLTTTFNIRTFEGALARVEVRYDRSTLDVFDGFDSRAVIVLGMAFVY